MQSLLARISTLTRKGQITLPAGVREKLNLKPGDAVAFEVRRDKVSLKPLENPLKSVFGSVKPLKRKISFKEQKRIALEDKLNAIR